MTRRILGLAALLSWLCLSPALGEETDPRVPYNLGVRHMKGDGVPKDFALAAENFRKAAAQDLPLARADLASLYASSRGVPRNGMVAYALYLSAASEPGVASPSNDAAFRCELNSKELAEAPILSKQLADPARFAAALDAALAQ